MATYRRKMKGARPGAASGADQGLAVDLPPMFDRSRPCSSAVGTSPWPTRCGKRSVTRSAPPWAGDLPCLSQSARKPPVSTPAESRCAPASAVVRHNGHQGQISVEYSLRCRRGGAEYRHRHRRLLSRSRVGLPRPAAVQRGGLIFRFVANVDGADFSEATRDDGAYEVDPAMSLIKGGGALLREKIVAGAMGVRHVRRGEQILRSMEPLR